jgi:hypothetical protein
LILEAPLDVPYADTTVDAVAERLGADSGAAIVDCETQVSAVAGAARFNACADCDMSADLARSDAVLHGIFHERLQDERRHTHGAQTKRHVNRHAQAVFKPRPLDVEIRLDDVNFSPQGRKLALRCEHASQQGREAQQRIERSRRGRLNQVTNGRQRVEEEVWIDLCAERFQLRFSRKLADFLFADLAIEPLAGDSNGVDSPRHSYGDGLERRDIVGQKPPAAREVVDVDAE